MVDTSVLAWIIDPAANMPAPPVGVVGDVGARLQQLVAELDRDRAELAIPTPVLAEIFSAAGRDPAAILADLSGRSGVLVLPFSEREAIECGLLLREMLPVEARQGRPRQLVKFDAQIVAIAKTAGASMILTTDAGLAAAAKRAGIAAPSLWDFPMPLSDAQGALPLDPPAAAKPPGTR